MSERRFKVKLGSGCLMYEVVGVMVKGEDDLWRYWIEFDGHCIPGPGEFPPTRAGHAQLKAYAQQRLGRLVWSSRHRGTPEDVQ